MPAIPAAIVVKAVEALRPSHAAILPSLSKVVVVVVLIITPQ